MSRDLFNRYIWIVDMLRKHRRLTRQQFDELWRRSPYGNGDGIPRRTFYNYRNAIEDLFGIVIECDNATYEYRIRDDESSGERSLTAMMLSSAAISNALTDARGISDRIFLEEVPSAHHHLDTVIAAMREMHSIRFTYAPFSRSMATRGLVLEPYFLKIFRQRWYATGRVAQENSIKTYALDRMSDVEIDGSTFTLPSDFDANNYVSDSFGIVFSQGKPHDIVLRTDVRQAKYLRALPLHHSQREEIGNGYSLFYYRLRLTPDLVDELTRLGPSVTVEKPAELKMMVIDKLKATLNNYVKDKSEIECE